MMRIASERNARSATASAPNSSTSHCAVCYKRLYAFRRRHRCQLCHRATCSHCIRSPQQPRASLRSQLAESETSVRICLSCSRIQRERLQRERTQQKNRRRLRQLEVQYFGPRPERGTIKRRRSCGDLVVETVDAETHDGVPTTMPAVAVNVEEAQSVAACGICKKPMEKGDAIFTTACNHSFHWQCLTTHKSREGTSKCPTCCVVIEELAARRVCTHWRVHPGNRYCRDCGIPVQDLVVQAASQRPAWTRIPDGATFRVVGLRLVRLLDFIAFGCVRLLLATVLLVSAGIHRVARFPWVSWVDSLVFGCVRLLFHGALHIVYSFHRLLQPRRVDRIQQQRRNRPHRF